jgi:F-type H+-transporting ATPase subunit b
MLRKVRAILWAATIPLAVAVLLAEPSSFAAREAEEEHAGGEEHVTNPIQNLWDWGYRAKNVEGEPWHEGQHKMPPPFSMQLLNFFVFAFLMYRAGGPSLARAVRERHIRIADALAEGTKLRDRARARLDEYDRKLAGLQGEIDALVREIRAEAEAEKKRIIAEAETRAERMQREAEQQIQAEMQRVRATLEREAVVAAVSIAEKLLAEKTTEADQRVLADKFVKGLQERAGKRRVHGS